MHKSIRLLFSVVCILAVTIVVSNMILRKPRLSQNDLHVLWLVSGRNFFVPSRFADREKNLMETNSELAKLNSYRDYFVRDKKPGVFRIFCVGGSTTRGWPFNDRFSYPRLLYMYLQDLLPEKEIEVINAGFCASDSFSDLPLIREIVEYQPDLLLLYEGRNEELQLCFHTGARSLIIKVHAWLLRHVYMYSFLKHMVLPHEEFDHARKIREYLLKDTRCDAQDIKKAFLANLQGMISEARNKGCATAVLTQVITKEEMHNEATVRQLNSCLRDIASQEKVILMDLEEVFAHSSLPQETLVIPVSVHPDLDGYFLMAQTVCEELAKRGMIAPAGDWQWKAMKPQSWYLRQTRVTPEYLSDVYTRRLGDFFRDQMKMPDIAQSYYKRAESYSCAH